MWHGFLSIFLFSSTGSPPINTWQTILSICEPIADITSLICTAISLVGAKISTCYWLKTKIFFCCSWASGFYLSLKLGKLSFLGIFLRKIIKNLLINYKIQRGSHISPGWLSHRSSVLVETEFEDFGFYGERKTREPGDIGHIGGRRLLSPMRHLCSLKSIARN